MNALTRRHFLRNTAAIGAAGAVVPVIAEASVSEAPVDENPSLLTAYDKMLEALDELAKARDALEWLIDEWRHLWPLAPEEILGFPDAHRSVYSESAERDIAGRYLFRDTADLTKALSLPGREKHPRTCFNIISSARCEERLEWHRQRKPKGRTSTALAKRIADKKRYIADWERNLALSREYEAETARVRELSGVAASKASISHAQACLNQTTDAISNLPAITKRGFVIKAHAVKVSFDEAFSREAHALPGALGAAYHLAVAFLAAEGDAIAGMEAKRRES